MLYPGVARELCVRASLLEKQEFVESQSMISPLQRNHFGGISCDSTYFYEGRHIMTLTQATTDESGVSPTNLSSVRPKTHQFQILASCHALRNQVCVTTRYSPPYGWYDFTHLLIESYFLPAKSSGCCPNPHGLAQGSLMGPLRFASVRRAQRGP